MSDLATAARPYARAVFELARDRGTLGAWGDALATLAGLAAVPEMRALFGLPGVDRERVGEIVCEAAHLDDEPHRNLIRLLAQNQRLLLLPYIRDAFDELRRTEEQSADVTLTTAAQVEESLRESLARAVERHLGRRAAIRWEVDESLIAGARIRAGDQVIDASAASQLEQLRESLTA